MADLTTTNPETTRPAASVAIRIADLLAEEGYRPKVAESDGPFQRIDFKAEGARFIVRVSDKDPDFVAVILGYLLDEPIPEMEAILRIGFEVQSEAKVAKFFVDSERTYFEMQAELFLGGQPLTARHVERCIAVLRRAAADFSQRLSAAAPQAQA